MLEEAAFLKAIADGDDTARLAFADWLEERGDGRAVWVRDPKVFAWMLPDGRDPVPALIAALPKRLWDGSQELDEAFRRVGSHAAPALLEALERNDEASRDAAEVLANMGPEVVTPLVPRLTELIRTQSDHYYLAVIAIAGAGAAAAGVVPDLIFLLHESRYGDGADNTTIETLGAIGPAAIAAVPALVDQFHFQDNHAGDALVGIGPTATRTILREAANLDSDWMVKAVYPLRCYGEAVVGELRAALTDENNSIRYLAAMGLAPLDGEAATPVLLLALGEEYRDEFRASVLESLGLAAASAPAMVPQIRLALQECSPYYAPPWYPNQIEDVLNSLDRTPEEQVIAALSSGQWWWQRNVLLVLDKKPTPPPPIIAAIVPLLVPHLEHLEVRRLAHGILARAKRLSRPALIAALHASCNPDNLHHVAAYLRSTDLPPLPKVLREAIESLAS